MGTKWENFLKNLGEWRGSFAQFSLEGDLLRTTNSIINLESFDDQQAVLFRVRRFGEGGYDTPPTQDYQQEYRTLGRQILVFDTGAFSKGTIQVSPFSEFGAEYGFVAPDRRLRVVQLYDKQNEFQGLTLIREFRANTTAPERPPLSVDQLLGVWEGQACTEYADWQNPTEYATRLEVRQIDEQHVIQTLEFGGQQISSTARVQGNQLWFEGEMPRVITLLPAGASSNIPLKVSHKKAFVVEVGWLVSPTERQRLIRQYDGTGAWTGSTFIREVKRSEL